jgi:hypothetical protein
MNMRALKAPCMVAVAPISEAVLACEAKRVTRLDMIQPHPLMNPAPPTGKYWPTIR